MIQFVKKKSQFIGFDILYISLYKIKLNNLLVKTFFYLTSQYWK